MSDATRAPEASRTTLRILNLLMRHFAHGITNKDIAQALGLQPSAVTRHVQALEEEGYAERIPETGRIRPSVRHAQACFGVLQGLDTAVGRMTELKTRITTPNQ